MAVSPLPPPSSLSQPQQYLDGQEPTDALRHHDSLLYDVAEQLDDLAFPPAPPPQSPLSSPFSIHSHRLREAQLASFSRMSAGLDGGGGGLAGEGGYGYGSAGEATTGGTPYFEAQGESLFGPLPGSGGWSPLPSPAFVRPSTTSPTAAQAPAPARTDDEAVSPQSQRRKSGGGMSSDERRRLRDKYALGAEEESKLGRLLNAVYSRIGAAGGGGDGDGTRRGGQAPTNADSVDSASPPRPLPASITPIDLTHLSLPDSPPSTTSSRRTRRRDHNQTIETILAQADGSPRYHNETFEASQTPVKQESSGGSEPFFTPPEQLPGSTAPNNHRLTTFSSPARSPRRASHVQSSPSHADTTTSLDSPPPNRPPSPRSGRSSPFVLEAGHGFSSSPLSGGNLLDPPLSSPRPPILSPPTSPPADRSLTPAPTPPLSSAPFFPDPGYQRPAMYRQLGWDYLPSRTAVRSTNRPTVDGELSEAERQRVEITRRVPNDGSLRDWWGNPVGERGQWGRAVLSPILTETEPTHSSPASTALRSPLYQSFALPTSPRSIDFHRAPRLASSPLSESSYSQARPSSRQSVPRTSPSKPPRPNGVVGDYVAPGEDHDDQLDAVSTIARHREPITNVDTSASSPNPADNSAAFPPSSPRHPSRSGTQPAELLNTSPSAPSTVDATRSGFSPRPSPGKTSAPGGVERSPHGMARPASISSWRADEIGDWRSRIGGGGEAEGMGSPRSSGSRRAGGEESARATSDQARLAAAPPAFGERHSRRLCSTPPSPLSQAVPVLPHPDEPRPDPTGRSPADIAAWANAARGADVDVDSPTSPPPKSLMSLSSSAAGRGERRAEFSSASSARPATPPGGPTYAVPEHVPTSLDGAASPTVRRSSATIGPDLRGERGLSMDSFSSSPRHPSPHELVDRTIPSSWSPRRTLSTDPHVSRHLFPADDPASGFVETAEELNTLSQDQGDQHEQSFPAGQRPLPEGFDFASFPLDGAFSPSINSSSPHSFQRSAFGRGRPLRPYRLGAYPVPQLTEEEKAARRALRKSGKSPEFDKSMEQTKAEIRKKAWKDLQAFEKEKTRLLRILDDQPGAATEIYNALGYLHLNSIVPADRDLATQYFLASLAQDQTQSDIAHEVALQLEEQDLLEAIRWHRVALDCALDNPEYHLSFARALTLNNEIDAALDGYTAVSQAFPGTPYEALALYHLGRLYYECGRPEERPNVKEAYQNALEVLSRLRLVDPAERRGGRWHDLDELERRVLSSLEQVEKGASGLPSPKGNEVGGDFVSPATLRRPVSSLHSQPGHVRSPSAPPACTSKRYGGRDPTAASTASRAVDASRSAISTTSTPEHCTNATLSSPSSAKLIFFFPQATGHAPLRPPRPDSHAQARPRASSASRPPFSARPPLHHPSSQTMDVILSSLRRMARSTAPADLARSSDVLASHLDEVYRTLVDLSASEAEQEEELRRSLEELKKEVEGLPARLVASAKLASARAALPAYAPEPPAAKDPLEEAVEKLERAREQLVKM
ncbi:hypothetical protein JCM8547_007221 [Rhodosporidiobolus lusitaniae]